MIKIILTILLIAVNTGCVNGGKTSLPFLAYLDLSNKANVFSVSQITPGSGVSGIPLNTAIQVTFSGSIDTSSVNASTFYLMQGGTLIPSSLAITDTTAVLTPNSPLSASTIYTATIAKEIKSASGTALTDNFTWSFTTAATLDLIAPAVSLTTPNNGSPSVPNNSSVSVAFSENVNCTTLNAATFTLDNGAAVPGTVSCAGTAATFTPAGALAQNTTYTAKISTGAKDLAGNSVAALYAWNFTTGTAPDITPPNVSFISPINGSTGFSINGSISFTFDEAMTCASITSGTVTLDNGGTGVVGTVTCSGTSATFTPAAPLNYGTTYTATITTLVKDLASNYLSAPFIWSFTTGAGPDVTPPTVSLVSPANGTINVGVNTSVSAVFSEPMACATLTTASFTLTGGAAIPGTVSCAGTSATFSPSVALAYNTTYTAKITTGAKDLATNSVAAIYTWTFTTGNAPDTTAPTVSFVSPANGFTGFAINGSLSISFSEVVSCATVTSTSIVLSDGSAIPGTVGCSGTSATFTPSSSLAYGTAYTATIATTVTDLAGNPLAVPFSWSFSTGAAPDTTAPIVSLVTPANSLLGVGVNSSVSVVFSETMNCATITNASFTLTGGAAVAGTVTCSGTSATFTPGATLAYNTTYTANITTAAKDLAGNSIPALYSWSFTTGVAPDTTPPTVSFVSPTVGATNVPVNSILSIAFSESLNCATITTTSVTLAGGGAIAGTVGCSGTTATFTPFFNLGYGTTYTATLTTAIKDSAGNSLAAPYTWTFTTGATPDVIAPSVSMEYPNPGQTGVAPNATITVAFSETMDCTTLTTATFTLGGAPGTVSCSGTTATFTPSPNLNPGTNYMASITAGAKDLAGNPASPFTWSFWTGAALDVTAPTVTIQNLKNKTVLESGMILGTAADGNSVAGVEISIDAGAYFTVSGTTNWSYKTPSGASQWRIGSQHTISVKSRDGANNYSAITTVTFRQGTNKDINGDGYVDTVIGAENENMVYIFHSSGTAGITATSAPAANRYIIGPSTSNFGKSVALADVNGDGYADVLVGAPLYGGSTGRAYVFNSSGSAGVTISWSTFASTMIVGAAANEQFGAAVLGADTNGDGYSELVVGAPGASTSRGKVYVFNSAGNAGIVDFDTTTASAMRQGTASNDLFGSALASGQINNTGGDTYEDIVIGSYGYSGQRGAVYVYHGSSTGIGAAPATTIQNPAPATGTGVAGDKFGYAVACGDISGDGHADIAVGMPGQNTSRGRVLTYSSSATAAGITASTVGGAILMINGSTANNNYGYFVKLRDLDNNGNADIIVTAVPPAGPPAVNGLVYVHMNIASGFVSETTATLTMTGPLSELYGWGLGTGDVNGDGYADLYVGSWGYNGFNGKSYIFHSSSTGLTTNNPALSNTTIIGNMVPPAMGYFGAALY
ncbi:Ig-like domain-containing protein [Leptospira barantonii]|nr:Ig-like domain-containing protein [Leptospira barantonii]